MSLAGEYSGMPAPCEYADQCQNTSSQEMLCVSCKFAKRFPGLENLWRPARKGDKHPEVVLAKFQAKQKRKAEKAQAKASRDRAKMAVQHQAKLAERKTERAIIKATRNSGRSNRDGDHVMAGITLDTKLQTGRINPVVLISEMAKVREDALRGGNSIGALVLRNSLGHGFVVLAEEDFAVIVKEISQ